METLSDQWLCFFGILNRMASISVKAWGWWGHLATVRFRVSSNLFYCLLVLFRFPFFRDLFLSFGMCDVSKESIRHICTKEAGGNIAIIIVGGAAESLDARPGSCTITLKDRKGFIRMALLTGLVLFTKAESTKVTVIYLFKVSNWKTRKIFDIRLKSIIKTLEFRCLYFWLWTDFTPFLVFLLLALNRKMFAGLLSC